MKIFCIELKDGRKFKISCENKSQIDRFTKSLKLYKINPVHVSYINGIHTVKQWEQLIKII